MASASALAGEGHLRGPDRSCEAHAQGPESPPAQAEGYLHTSSLGHRADSSVTRGAIPRTGDSPLSAARASWRPQGPRLPVPLGESGQPEAQA